MLACTHKGSGAIVAIACLTLFFGCASPETHSASSQPVISHSTGADGVTRIHVTLPPRTLAALRASKPSRERLAQLLRVTVRSAEHPTAHATAVPAMLGEYEIGDRAMAFTPMFPLDPGRVYAATFDPAQLPDRSALASSDEPITTVIPMPAKPESAASSVEHVFPTVDVLPENQLKIYVQFSGAMGLADGLQYVTLLDEDSKEVEAPFLPLGDQLWDRDRRRFTVFFDPGRVKRDLQVHREMGRPIRAGRTYTLVIDRAWPDADGRPMRESFRKTFRAGPADQTPVDPQRWRVQPPLAGARDPLIVTFGESLDRALLQRALTVHRADGSSLEGMAVVDDREQRWSFTPAQPWRAARYQLHALSVLEDLAGNQIGRPFEVDTFQQADAPSTQPTIVTLPFQSRHDKSRRLV